MFKAVQAEQLWIKTINAKILIPNYVNRIVKLAALQLLTVYLVQQDTVFNNKEDNVFNKAALFKTTSFKIKFAQLAVNPA